ncbi:MAG: sulfotransferase [Pseudomonadota bacterium]
MHKVIYIVGYGRSGSTILDISMGSHPTVFGMGELSAMCRHVWERREYCACGAQIRNCEVWRQIMERWMAERDVAEYKRLQQRVEPLFSVDRTMRTRRLWTYLDDTEAMLGAVSEITGTTTLVDSSKAPGRALAFAMSDQIDLRVVHLVRDARGVAHSMGREIKGNKKSGVQKKIVPRSPYRTAIRWRMYNSFAEKLGMAVGPQHFVRVRYEDFADDAAREMQRISAATGVDFSDVGDHLANGGALMPAHQMAGSRLRMKSSITLQFDKGWESRMTPADQNKVVRVAADQLRRYGYVL